MKVAAVLYLALTVVFLIDIVLAITVLEFVKQSINVRERPKLVTKIYELKRIRKYAIIWPYVLYKLISEDVK
jgi:pilus assembly protein TadC